jgi:hypothetical protein
MGDAPGHGQAREDAREHGEPPRPRDHDPAAVLSLRPVEQDAGDDPIAEQDQYGCADNLTYEHVTDHPLR